MKNAKSQCEQAEKNANSLTEEDSRSPVAELFMKASCEIKAGEYDKARVTLREASGLDMENPEAYNLLGISYELEGDILKAAKFYRISYYMDQTFSAPSENLSRVSRFWYQSNRELCWGLERIKGAI